MPSNIISSPPGFQDAQPFAVCGLGIVQIPYEVPRYDEVEGLVGEFQDLCVHPFELRIHSVSGTVVSGLVQHGLCTVHPGHAVAESSQDHREESGSGTDVQDVKVPALSQMFQDYVQPMAVGAFLYLLGDGPGVSGGPLRLVPLYAHHVALGHQLTPPS